MIFHPNYHQTLLKMSLYRDMYQIYPNMNS